jgi:hypothetical protein
LLRGPLEKEHKTKRHKTYLFFSSSHESHTGSTHASFHSLSSLHSIRFAHYIPAQSLIHSSVVPAFSYASKNKSFRANLIGKPQNKTAIPTYAQKRWMDFL